MKSQNNFSKFCFILVICFIFFSSQKINGNPRPIELIINGRIEDSKGMAMEGVTVTLSRDIYQTCVTEEEGTYYFLIVEGGQNYVVTPTKPGWGFEPRSRSLYLKRGILSGK